MSKEVRIFTTRICPYCIAAKRLLTEMDVKYTEFPVDGDAALRQQMMDDSGQRTVPQIWIGEHHVGGYTDLAALYQSGKLEALLQA